METTDTPIAGDLESVVDDLVDNMPPVSESLHQQLEEPDNHKKTDAVDTDGNHFDTNLHRVDKDGNPLLSVKGRLIKKPGRSKGAKPGNSTTVSNSTVAAPSSEEIAAEREAANIRAQGVACGKVAANLLFSLCSLISDEWKPVINEAEGINERDYMEQAFGDYFIATGKTDIPPGMALSIAIGGYAVSRLTMPKTKTRFGKLGNWFRKKWASRKLKKYGLKAQEIEDDGGEKDEKSGR